MLDLSDYVVLLVALLLWVGISYQHDVTRDACSLEAIEMRGSYSMKGGYIRQASLPPGGYARVILPKREAPLLSRLRRFRAGVCESKRPEHWSECAPASHRRPHTSTLSRSMAGLREQEDGTSAFRRGC